jgi:hypothetical protein
MLRPTLQEMIFDVLRSEGFETPAHKITNQSVDLLIAGALNDATDTIVSELLVDGPNTGQMGPAIAKALLGAEIEEDDLTELLKDMAREYFTSEVLEQYEIARLLIKEDALYDSDS